MTRHLRNVLLMSAAILLAQTSIAIAQTSVDTIKRIEHQVRRELITLPFYSLFDHFAFRVDGSSVALMGKVTRPTLKSDAENAVKRIEGVENVVNQIEVLPLSPSDDRLRTRLYRAIYGHSALQIYSMRAVPPIHIIVQNGHVTLEGAVGNTMQKNIAGISANGVSGVFSLTNNLAVDSEK
jgi:hyperosmotically inducible periplasmic protein